MTNFTIYVYKNFLILNTQTKYYLLILWQPVYVFLLFFIVIVIYYFICKRDEFQKE